MTIRQATNKDIPAITQIYAHAVLTGTGSFETKPPDQDQMHQRMQAILKAGLPWLVYVENNEVLGYAYAGPFKARPAYAGTVEDSIYVSNTARRRGIGRQLLLELISKCTDLGKSQMIAGIGDSANSGSISVHKACGFREVGHLKMVGYKFERWLDVIYMQRELK